MVPGGFFFFFTSFQRRPRESLRCRNPPQIQPRRFFLQRPSSNTAASPAVVDRNAASRTRAFNPYPGLLACLVSGFVWWKLSFERAFRDEFAETAAAASATTLVHTARRTRAFTPIPGLLAFVFVLLLLPCLFPYLVAFLVSTKLSIRRALHNNRPNTKSNAATTSTNTPVHSARRTRAFKPFPGLLALVAVVVLFPRGAEAVGDSPPSSSLVPLVASGLVAALAVEALLVQPALLEHNPLQERNATEPPPTRPPDPSTSAQHPEEITREPESIVRSSPSSSEAPGEPVPTSTPIDTDAFILQETPALFQTLSPADVATAVSTFCVGDSVSYELKKSTAKKDKWDKRTGRVKEMRTDGVLVECRSRGSKQAWDELLPEQICIYRCLAHAPATTTLSAAAAPFTPESPPPLAKAASVTTTRRTKQAISATAASSNDFEVQELIAEENLKRRKTKQQEHNDFDSILTQAKEHKKRALQREASRTNPSTRDAQPEPQNAPPPPDLDDVNLTLWTALPEQLSTALGHVFAETIAKHGGSQTVSRDPGLLHQTFEEILSIPKTRLQKTMGASGAAQRKHTLQKLGVGPASPDETPNRAERQQKTADQSACARALRFFTFGFLGRAAKALDTEAIPQLPDDDAYEKLCAVHPEAVLDMPRCRGETFRTLVDPETLKSLVEKMANGAAAGPDGWTEDLLAPLLADSAVLHFVTAVTQSLVDGVAPASRKRITKSRLVGIPKPDGGIRPLAVGTIWLKIAARYLFLVHENAVLRHFSSLQFGCGEPNGSERVIHQTRRAHEQGETVCTIDARNAFNSPCRVALWKAVSSLACLLPFLGIFSLEYEDPSDLIWHGRDSTRYVRSSRGTRQGSVCGGLFFAAIIHPALLECRDRFPTVKVAAFLDDITLTSLDDEQLALAFLFLKAEFAKLLIEFNPSKCEILLRQGASLPESLVGEVSVKEDGVIKVLGAFIGDPERCSDKLLDKQKRHDHFFRRVALLAGPAAFAILSACGVPRASYFVRTHSTTVSATFVEAFESHLSNALVAISNARLDDHARLMAHLPDGLGITDYRRIAPLAYNASLGQCLPDSFPEPQNSQKVATMLLNSELVHQLLPLQKAILEETSASRGTKAWLTDNSMWITSHFAAAIRHRLGAAAADDPANLECAPCNTVFSSEDHPSHVTGCARRSGKGSPTKKHNKMRDKSAAKLRSVGVVCETEPRDYKAFVCNNCGDKFSKEASISHARTCRNSRFRPTGPDLRVEWGADADNAQDQEIIVYDWTVVHATAPSHRGKSLKALFAAKTAEKERLYGEMVRANGEKFVVLCISSHGVMSKETLAFIKRIAAATGQTPKVVRTSFLVALHQHNGAAIAQSRGRRWD